ncbi:MAG: GTPase/DUF3482 domain-containing protein [Planctomycetota bacterium]
MSDPNAQNSSPEPPRFVVVGHPNKGKSSIVATLAQDDAVRIAPEPGTTTRADAFELRIDGRLLYSLVDTPGFQRARAVLAWLREHETDAAEHPALVRRFVETPEHAERFPDEVALLRPLVDSAATTGVLYVVDGSTPYGPEYEPEMEILRWTGRPRMALVNPIGSADHVDQWRTALGQFFGTVRVFNAVDAPWVKRVELLEAFGQLDEAWQPTVRAGIDALRADRRLREGEAAELIAASLVTALRLREDRRLGSNEDASSIREALEVKYRQGLEKLEHDTRDRVEEAYGFLRLQREDESPEAMHALLGELFAESTWNQLGLSRKQLLAAGALSAAGGGVVLDLAAQGLSFGVFTAGGALLGAAGAWWGGGKLPETKVLGLPMGGNLARVGPMRNPNFAFVWLGRARLHHRHIAQRTHARRDTLVLEPNATLDWSPDVRRRVVRAIGPLIKKPDSLEAATAARAPLVEAVRDVLREDATLLDAKHPF